MVDDLQWSSGVNQIATAQKRLKPANVANVALALGALVLKKQTPSLWVKKPEFVGVSNYELRSASTHRASEWIPEVCGQYFEVTRPKVKGHQEVKLL